MQSSNSVEGGLVRTGIGILVGIAIGIGFRNLAPVNRFMGAHGDTVFFAGLVPVRAMERYFFLWLLYGHCNFDRVSQTRFIFIGIIVSFILDFIGLHAVMVIPGGAWIC